MATAPLGSNSSLDHPDRPVWDWALYAEYLRKEKFSRDPEEWVSQSLDVRNFDECPYLEYCWDLHLEIRAPAHFTGVRANPPLRAPVSIWPEKGIVKRLSRLKEFVIYMDNIATLPDWLGDLPQLKKLKIYMNYPEKISNISPIELPLSIGRSGRLEEFQCTQVKLAPLPPTIGDLPKITRISLYDNGLTGFPQSIRNLTSLQYFGIGRNPIKSIPKVFTRLVNLKKIEIGEMPLKSLPDDFQNLQDLSKIQIDHTKIADLPPSFGQLAALKHLDLNFNAFHTVPSVIKSLHSLYSLQLARNKIKTLPSWLRRLPNLRELQIDFIPLQRDLDDWARNHRSPYPQANPITAIPDWIRHSRLQKVQMGAILRSLHGLPPRAQLWALNYGRNKKLNEIPFTDLPIRVIRWLKIAIQSEYLNPHLRDILPLNDIGGIGDHADYSINYAFHTPILHRLAIYYTKSTPELAHELVVNGKLTHWEMERLIHEITPSLRTYLEEHLDPHHPIFQKLTDRYQIDQNDEVKILL